MISNNHKFLSHPALLKIFKRDYQKGEIKDGYSSGFTPLQILKNSLLVICKLRSKDSNSFTPLEKKIANFNLIRRYNSLKGLIDSHKKFVTGFTLLEVLIVVIIIGILSSIALPNYVKTIEKARSSEAIVNVGAIRVALDRYWYQNGYLPANDNFSEFDIDNPNNVTNRLFIYSFRDDGTTNSIRKYNVTAIRLNNPDIWVKWSQLDNITGKLTRSANLGGPTS